ISLILLYYALNVVLCTVMVFSIVRCDMSQPDILTVQEVADLLRVSERTVYDWATSGQIPCGKLGTAWRFKRSEIEAWIDQNLASGRKSIPSPLISIRDLLLLEHVVMFDLTSKRQALQLLIDTVSTHPAVGNAEDAANGIYHREELMSTGIGFGVAVPHVRLKSIIRPVMAVGISKSDITDYESLDGKPVRILFMILAGIGQHAEHIKALAKISGFVRDAELRNCLLNANDPKNIFDLLVEKAN
ncbi:MAG: PTS sugar transporter subunit IIA, partial [Anaerohalosphaera sp.]|nr:PTS sugar transporter subunit IIA [Anaerohalosphaera sp.]